MSDTDTITRAIREGRMIVDSCGITYIVTAVTDTSSGRFYWVEQGTIRIRADEPGLRIIKGDA